MSTDKASVNKDTVKKIGRLARLNIPEEQQEKIAQSTLVKRVGTAEHIAHAVQFLCENTFVNGSFITVDGGRSIFAPDGLQVGMNTG